MLFSFLKKTPSAAANPFSRQDEKTFQQSTLRVLLILTLSIFVGIEIDYVLSALQSPEYHNALFINTAFLTLLCGFLFFSKSHTKFIAGLYILSLVAIGASLLLFSTSVHAEKYAIVALYSVPLVTRLLFSIKAAVFAIAINFIPLYFIATGTIKLENLAAPNLYFKLLTFAIVNIGFPIGVSRMLKMLEANTTQMKLLYRKLNENYALHEEFFENTSTPTLLCDKRGKIIKANQMALDFLSCSSASEIKNTKVIDWLKPSSESGKFSWQENVAECSLKHKKNTQIQLHRATLKQGRYVLHFQNMTHLRAMQQKLESTQETNSRLVNFDTLTRLANHPYFCNQVNQFIETQDKHLTGTMFIIHISQFKLFNKQYGKDNANKVIINFAKILKEKLSDQAIIGRLRGVKFACFVPLGNTYLIEKNLSALISSTLPSQLKIDGNLLNMNYQVGIAYYQTDGKNAEELLERCEMALEYSTIANRFSYYSHPLETKLIKEHKLGIKLSSAIKRKEIDLWLQPQVSPNGTICSFEALARWKLDDGSYVPPDVFIKIAEELGLLPVLAENLIRQLVSTLSKWHKEHIHTPIAFNLAGQELMNDGFFALLMTLVIDHPWLKDMLELEITETSPVMTHALIHKRLRALSEYGFSIAIDDFGTGQASLGQLIDIPANILKIDRRFVSPLPEDLRHLDIVKSTIQLANSLDMKVIAEGIETKEQASLLISLGCHTLQGYYYGKPSPMTDWTANQNQKAKELRMVY
ncbi:bifunctional diguanylate cyclase/phosphodiesterase [Marinomonas transparens]|uniref:Bifunctional diguanylate cyclase/phosphodiesterase n=1 Tax=Marinomonas transparens TaxID=2795388 RepID=A0A934JSL4_9GAMM|nr:bifunctional diguanylate cyclase/phosphodiesterase [Marinomonas transparens]MBJ7537587.1 bifunctional diguanylate cyclase/phosphodiesterase [Marinomonas transparens]